MVDTFTTCNNYINIKISSDSNYAFYLNGKLEKFMNCSDYPFYKFFDEYKLKCKKGLNKIVIQVWHFGINSQTYINSKAGLIYEISERNKVLSFSSSLSKIRTMDEYKNQYNKIITRQLGLSFYYDNTVKKSNFKHAVEINKKYDFYERKINSLELNERPKISILKMQNSLIIDLNEEIAGFLDLDITSPTNQLITIAYGEHINDNCVRQIIGERNFSVEFYAKKEKILI